MASWSRWNIQKAKMWYNELVNTYKLVFIGFGGKNTKISNICHLLFCKSPYEISQLWVYPFFPVLLLLLLCKIRLSLAPLFWYSLWITFHFTLQSRVTWKTAGPPTYLFFLFFTTIPAELGRSHCWSGPWSLILPGITISVWFTYRCDGLWLKVTDRNIVLF